MRSPESLKSKVAILLGVFIFGGFLGGCFVVWLLILVDSYPSPESLARQYFDAVIHKDEAKAVDLASPYCQPIVRNEVRDSIEKFGGTETRNVSVEVKRGNGSDDQVRFVFVRFEYRKDGNQIWSDGEIGIVSTRYESLFRHIYCGG